MNKLSKPTDVVLKLIGVVLVCVLILVGCSKEKKQDPATLNNGANELNEEHNKKTDEHKESQVENKKDSKDKENDQLKRQVEDLASILYGLYDYKLATPKKYDDTIANLKSKNAVVNFDFRNTFLDSYTSELSEDNQTRVKSGIITSKDVKFDSSGLAHVTINYRKAVSVQNNNTRIEEVEKNIREILSDSEASKEKRVHDYQDVYEIKINTAEKTFEISLISSK